MSDQKKCTHCGREIHSCAVPKAKTLEKMEKLTGLSFGGLLCAGCIKGFSANSWEKKRRPNGKTPLWIAKAAAMRAIKANSYEEFLQARDSIQAEVSNANAKISDLIAKIGAYTDTLNQVSRAQLDLEVALANSPAASYFERRARADAVISDPQLRQRVFSKSGFCCSACGYRGALTVDHIIPVVNGGTDAEANLQGLCKRCNSSKGRRSMAEFMPNKKEQVA